ncbi:hypothetical protein TL16_g04184 [Triparma laevis f. inornata]|uniref:Uncharacterized protein n=1 Tax=Triparma laevis f. inornata TaxID=1714386 RepID=A0A9W7A760_9STRA|nr:hypothetical protein TL16_g04184 [Triparma laevis f. inornata]
MHSADGKQKSNSDPSSSSSFGPLSSSYLPALLCTLFVINLLNKIFGKKKKNLVVEEVGTWKQRSDSSPPIYTPSKVDLTSAERSVQHPPLPHPTTPRRSLSSSSSASWVFFSPAKPAPVNPLGTFKDHSENEHKMSPTLKARDPYTSSRLMRKHLLSLIPLLKQATLHEALTKMYLVAGEKDESMFSVKGVQMEAEVRAGKTKLMCISLFAAFEEEFVHGLPLPRSPTTRSIGIEQAVKDAVRERIEVDGDEVKYTVAASDEPDVAAGELTELLGGVVSDCTGREHCRDELGRLVGRILGALCRTGSGGDTYCAVNALFDIAGTLQKSRGLMEGEGDHAVFPFLIMPANVLEGQGKGKVGEIDVPGPLKVRCKLKDGKPVAEIVTTSLLDVHLADKVLQPGGREGKKGKHKNKNNGMAKPLVILKATIVEMISMEVESSDRERSLRLEVLD